MIGPDIIVFVALGALSGGFINGLAGFGTSLFALGFWLQVLPPVQAVAMSLVVALVTGIQGAWIVRRQIRANAKRLMRFVVPGIFFVPLGVATLTYVDPNVLKLIIAGFLILYGAYFIGRGSLPAFEKPARIVDACIGAIGGFLGGLAGLSGALPAMWVALRPWPRETTRAVLQPYNLSMLGIGTILLAFRGAYTTQTLGALVIALPVAMFGSQIGIYAFKRMPDQMFRWLLIVLMFVSGLTLMARVLLEILR